MTSLGLAFRTFFKILGDSAFAERVRAALAGDVEPAEPAAGAPITDKRSSALTLLATLQHEARFLDFVMEPLDGYQDAQVGAAARDVHRDLGTVVKRIFAPEPLAGEEEGSRVRVPAGFDPARFRLTGEVAGEPPYEGTLQHHGWSAAKWEMPAWTGDPDAASVVAPSEVEVGG